MNELGQNNAKATVKKYIKKFGSHCDDISEQQRSRQFGQAVRALKKAGTFGRSRKIMTEGP